MTSTSAFPFRRSAARAALLLALALTLPGCAGLSLFGSDAAPPAAPAVPAANVPASAADSAPGQGVRSNLLCPLVGVRTGTEVIRSTPPGMEALPTQLRWQATIQTTERECVENGLQVQVRVGIEGLVLLGPAGQPGTFDVPMRIALLRGENTVMWSRLVPLRVTVAPGESSAAFAHVEEGSW